MTTWQYADVSTTRIGLMRCSACSKQITEGQFRYREGREGFTTQHRTCSAFDGHWHKSDVNAKAAKEHARERLAAYIKFRDKWGTTALDEEIEQLSCSQ